MANLTDQKVMFTGSDWAVNKTPFGPEGSSIPNAIASNI